MFFQRALNLKSILERKSHFLFGARQTGKSSWIEKSLPEAHYINLLDLNLQRLYLANPGSFLQEIKAKKLQPRSIVVVDEIQKAPMLLNAVHQLIEEDDLRFLLTGSSAKKLKSQGINLLGGRAWRQDFLPLSHFEIPNFELNKYLRRGGLPAIYLSDFFLDELENYLNLYLFEEIKAEAYVRKLENFTSFLETMAIFQGGEINYSNISRESGVPARTVAEYIQVLIDSLVAYELKPFVKTKKRKAISRSKLYFFDLGVANQLRGQFEINPKTDVFGQAFEHFFINEIRFLNLIKKKKWDLQYWRSTSSKEVDLILSDEFAIEIKSSLQAKESYLSGLRALKEENIVNQYWLVSLDPVEKITSDGIRMIHWKDALDELKAHGV